jgi:hypothetical protein
MDRNDVQKRPSNEARDDELVFFCPTCASGLRPVISILDSRKGKTVRVFECKCGEIVLGRLRPASVGLFILKSKDPISPCSMG